MRYSTIIYAEKGRIAQITLNRPEADNIIDQQLARELKDICDKISQNDNIYAVVITGAEGGAFCKGSELERLVETGNTGKTLLANLKDANAKDNVVAAISSINQPVIAAINGDALGQGLELALSCDIRLASRGARFGFPQVASGLMPMSGGTQLLPRLIGRGKALELILTAEIISAEEAFEIGLINQVVPEQNLVSEVETLTRTMAAKAPIALRYIKEAVNKGLDLTLEQGLRLEADLYFLLHTTTDRTEGIKAFIEKRPPEFKGR